MLNHRVSVSVTQSNGVQTEVLKAREKTVRKRLLRFLLGDEMNVLVISPSRTVNSIEITELQKGGAWCAGTT